VFRATLAAGGIKPIQLPARSPNLNAYAEGWVRSAKEECVSKLILFGEASLRRALSAFIDHYHLERNHQGKDNLLLSPIPVLKAVREVQSVVASGSVACSSITATPHELFDQIEWLKNARWERLLPYLCP
jgi:hypothetical protein